MAGTGARRPSTSSIPTTSRSSWSSPPPAQADRPAAAGATDRRSREGRSGAERGGPPGRTQPGRGGAGSADAVALDRVGVELDPEPRPLAEVDLAGPVDAE